ncbi:hypothetical protein FKM82_030081 [Ascaphus truei]
MLAERLLAPTTKASISNHVTFSPPYIPPSDFPSGFGSPTKFSSLPLRLSPHLLLPTYQLWSLPMPLLISCALPIPVSSNALSP